MIYGAILAGGVGKRMKSVAIPKQFVELNGTPIIVLSLRKMLNIKRFSKIIVAIHGDWLEYSKQLLKRFMTSDELSSIVLIRGGVERLDSFYNAAEYVRNTYGSTDSDIIICHEAVRPFVSTSMLEKCIDLTLTNKIAATFVPVNDSIFIKDYSDSNIVVAAENRSVQVQGQTPSGFNINLLLEVLDNMSDAERCACTGTTQLFLNRGFKIPIVNGDTFNFKITTDVDLDVAEVVMRKGVDSNE